LSRGSWRRLASFQCRNRDDLYRAARVQSTGARASAVNNTFGIFANVSGNPNLRHSKFAALCLKDGVVDHFRDRLGKRPERGPPGARCVAEPARGEKEGHHQPRHIRRVAAPSGIPGACRWMRPCRRSWPLPYVALSEWDGRQPLYDPMCGSGTLLCEAALLACRIPAGYLRKGFGFRFLPDFDRKLWNDVKTKADQGIIAMPAGLVAGSDVARHAVKASRVNSNKLPHGDRISIIRSNFRNLKGLEKRGDSMQSTLWSCVCRTMIYSRFTSLWVIF
jgi:putative N6-adenine-specific DNA methylase